eukprot:TRINITY_DN4030_c0_g1_i1.p3 TRINITY_DN4030_c0_g1~~TRINITY_DN4030_c0_g1_i1.p3  ORF type:complete len:149 (+),score=3.98 TRINITY_DN4030_c0_g1_i1:704-1150(+)
MHKGFVENLICRVWVEPYSLQIGLFVEYGVHNVSQIKKNKIKQLKKKCQWLFLVFLNKKESKSFLIQKRFILEKKFELKEMLQTNLGAYIENVIFIIPNQVLSLQKLMQVFYNKKNVLLVLEVIVILQLFVLVYYCGLSLIRNPGNEI